MRAIANYLDTVPELSTSDKAKLNYFFSCIIYEGSKIVLFLIFFTVTQRLKGFLYSMIILLPLRIISGGIHFKHYLSCLAFSFGYFYLVNVPLGNVMPTFEMSLLILFACIFINCLVGPVVSDSRPALDPERIKRGRLHVFIATVYDTLLTALFFESPLAPIGFWTIVLHSLQLIIGKLRKKRGEKCV